MGVENSAVIRVLCDELNGKTKGIGHREMDLFVTSRGATMRKVMAKTGLNRLGPGRVK